MTLRRAVLSVPASEASKIAKAQASTADEVVVDLEDAVSLDQKDAARANVLSIPRRSHGALAVRVNAVDSPWFERDVAAAHANPAVDAIVVPKVDSAAVVARIDAQLQHEAAASAENRRPLDVQPLIETPLGLANAREIACSSDRIVALILGYADLAASMGRHPSASWQFAQDAVVLAARVGRVQAIDGPILSVEDDETLADAARAAESLGFDGKWVIHPRQIVSVKSAFIPSAEEVEDAREVLRTLDAAARAGAGAVEWRGRMLDEAVAAQARRTVERAVAQPMAHAGGLMPRRRRDDDPRQAAASEYRGLYGK